MFRKVKNIFGYIWPILHNFFNRKVLTSKRLMYCLRKNQKKSSSTPDMIPADSVAETEKGKNVVKLEGISCQMT